MMLYSLGSNGNYQLGLKHEEDISKPEKVNFPEQPKRIACGGNHTLILDQNGHLWACGDNRKLQCCQTFDDVIVDELINNLKPLKSDYIHEFQIANRKQWSMVAAGWEFSVLVGKDRRTVWTCGAGPHGELGQGEVGGSSLTKIMIPYLNQNEIILDISSSVKHWICVTNQGNVYGCGDGRKGQLGPVVPKMTNKVQFLAKVEHAHKVCCGLQFSAFLQETGRVSILGGDRWNLSEECMRWQDNNPKLSSLIVDISSNWSTLSLLDSNGRIYAFGRGDRAQKAHTVQNNAQTIAGGSEHNIVQTKSMEAYIYGWNEHGNAFNEDRQDVYQAKNLRLPGAVTYVAAGYATTWIATENE
ncbi:RCC domain-containing protein Ats1 [Schizosaccharomyces cryophilus OY26]|uniref:RCC domain-containing protein Ats1 n=1 Tax=Schizosaccharomyces cryophilus (strain OY26 / ATCC MYA-4695 / CBS 11777 / NBRC 106824 / NRRL Y48691) TaxID=653667 RepID=S9XAV0_SCHCR|nr:RCC domain-containing protein Ats1 [Schizosaccharomyces cryophilus OY26]EPY50861.1 RCC domain-containing protein Ats1 [Schizosaccharomyces cryophilus OY26]